jgi:hypothetical protein
VGEREEAILKAWKVLGAALAVALLGGPATASARDGGIGDGLSQVSASTLSCVDPTIERPFTAFGDDNAYVLAPNGSFESTAGWDLDGATAAAGNDPFDLRPGSTDADSTILSMPEGSVATSPLMCVDPTYPTFRFPVRLVGRQATVRVEVAYPFARWGGFRKSDQFTLRGSNDWGISPELDLDPERGGTGPGWRPMAIRLIVKDGAPGTGVQLDDVYVDPRARW